MPWGTTAAPRRVAVKSTCRRCQMPPGLVQVGVRLLLAHTLPFLASAPLSAGVFMVLVGRWGRNRSRNRWEATGIQGAMPELVTRGQLVGDQGKHTVRRGALELEEPRRRV